AEDGIRDGHVTGVQTCALPIYALAVALLEKHNFRHDDFAALHPAGRLGKKLVRVEHLMHSGSALPRVAQDSSMPDVFHEMSAKRSEERRVGKELRDRWVVDD